MNHIEMNQKRLQAAISAAVAAGNLLIRHSDDFLEKIDKSNEAFREVVTEADRYSEAKIIEILKGRTPDLSILTEESGWQGGEAGKDRTYWAVDPLDGTVNYLNHIPFYAVSIALMEGGKPVVGVVYNPVSNELFYGAYGLGVFKNRKKISLQDKKPEESLFAASFSPKGRDEESRRKEFLAFQEVNDFTMGCVRTGSAALNLAYVAEGRLGGCWGRGNKIWDVAAGLLLADAAGAKVSFNIQDKTVSDYIASAPASWDFLEDSINHQE